LFALPASGYSRRTFQDPEYASQTRTHAERHAHAPTEQSFAALPDKPEKMDA
jgi:hypothetical protein